MILTPERKKEFYKKLVSDIIKHTARIIGGTAYTLASGVSGISVSKEQEVSISDSFGKENLEGLVSAYAKIVGPVAKTLAIHAAALAEKPHGATRLFCDDCAELVPEWLFKGANALVETGGS
jgi:hypothetical protein